MLTIITEDLLQHLPSNHKLLKHKTVNSTNFEMLHQILQDNLGNELVVYDYTWSKKLITQSNKY